MTVELRRIVVLVVVGSLVGLVWNPQSLRGRPDAPAAVDYGKFVPGTIGLDEVRARFEDSTLIAVDARQRRAYEAGHVPGALAAFDDGGRSLIPVLRRWIPVGSDVVVISGGDGDFAATRLAGRLRMMGAARTRVLKGGMEAWIEAQLPLARGWDMESVIAEGGR